MTKFMFLPIQEKDILNMISNLSYVHCLHLQATTAHSTKSAKNQLQNFEIRSSDFLVKTIY